MPPPASANGTRPSPCLHRHDANAYVSGQWTDGLVGKQVVGDGGARRSGQDVAEAPSALARPASRVQLLREPDDVGRLERADFAFAVSTRGHVDRKS